MKKLLFLVILLFSSFVVKAQDCWVLEEDKMDTLYSCPNLGIVGDVISGYTLVPVPEPYVSEYIYQLWWGTEDRKPVKRIVALTDIWSFTPDSLKGTEYGDFGNKLAAVTEREYQSLLAAGKIWGDLFTCVYPPGLKGECTDTLNVPSYQLGFWKRGEIPTDVKDRTIYNFREIAHIFRVVGNDTIWYQCLLPDKNKNVSDYSHRNNTNLNNTNWMMCTKEQAEMWMRRLEYFRSQGIVDF